MKKLDSGPISNIYKIKIDQNSNAQEVSEQLSLLAADKILDNIDDILDDKSKFIEQNHSKSTYAKKDLKSEGQINWNDDASKNYWKNKWFTPLQELFLILMVKDIKF